VGSCTTKFIHSEANYSTPKGNRKHWIKIRNIMLQFNALVIEFANAGCASFYTTKTISKRSRGAGAQDWPRVSSAAVGRCVDKLPCVAPEDKLLTAAIGALGKMGQPPRAPSPAGRRRRRSRTPRSAPRTTARR
jgi:hypothetical protein